MVLLGSEVKSLRQGKVSFVDSFARIENGEAWLYNLHITPYDKATYQNHEPLRTRKLLFNRREIKKIQVSTQETGLTLVPLKIYLQGKYIKVEIGLAKGKKLYDKRDTIAQRDAKRKIEKAMKDRG